MLSQMGPLDSDQVRDVVRLWFSERLLLTLSPMNPWVQWKKAQYLKGNDPIGNTPIFDFHDYGRKCILK